MTALAERIPAVSSLDALAETANREHALCVQAAEGMVRHAIACGQALLAAREQIEPGGWDDWLEDNLDRVHSRTAYEYMRIARHADLVLANGVTSFAAARRFLREQRIPAARRRASDPELEAEAIRLCHEGMCQRDVAEILGVSQERITYWVNPAALKKKKARLARARAERKAAREREQARAERRLARKVGGAVAEAYSMAHRLEDELGEAHREAGTPEGRDALALALGHFHKMKDEIVRALGAES